MRQKSTGSYRYATIFFVILVHVSLALLFLPELHAGGRVHVNGYFRKSGTYVAPHYRSAPDKNFYNNWSTKGNINPYTGVPGTKVSPPTHHTSIYPSQTCTSGNVPKGTQVAPKNRSSQGGNIHGVWGGNVSLQNSPSKTTYHEKTEGSNCTNDASPNMSTQEIKGFVRAKYWKKRGYEFNPILMTASEMDQKVRDIEQATYSQTQEYDFGPETKSTKEDDQKIRDIERATYWEKRGYVFDPDRMTASMMDQKVRDIERAKYWEKRGYHFDPDIVSSYEMDYVARKNQNDLYGGQR